MCDEFCLVISSLVYVLKFVFFLSFYDMNSSYPSLSYANQRYEVFQFIYFIEGNTVLISSCNSQLHVFGCDTFIW